MSALDAILSNFVVTEDKWAEARKELADLRSEKSRLAQENIRLNNNEDFLDSRIAELEAETVSLHHVISECEDYLKSMVEQYCRHSSGENRYCHDFMSAGECTFEYLVARGLAEYTENGVDIRLKVKE